MATIPKFYIKANTYSNINPFPTWKRDSDYWEKDASNNLFYMTANIGIGYPIPRGKLVVDGTVGIGTNIPQAALDVSGSILTSGQFLGQVNDTITVPSFSWTGDTNTGFYHPASDTLGIVTNGIERMRIDASGKIGIGITNPQAKLDISGGLFVTENIGIGTTIVTSAMNITKAYDTNNLLEIEQDIINKEFPPLSIAGTLIPDYTDTIESIDTGLYGLFEFPPIQNPLTSNTTAISGAMYGNGTYSVTYSSKNASYEGYLAFDKNNTNTSQWQSAVSTYNTSAPYSAVAGVTTVVSGVTYTGSWLQIQLPYNIVVKEYSLANFYAGSGEALPPSEHVLAGWDGGNWILLDFKATNFNIDSIVNYDISNNTGSYASYRYIVTKIVGNNSKTGINQIRFFANAYVSSVSTGLEFPPAAMTNYTTVINSTYGSGTYIASASSSYNSTSNLYAWNAFTKDKTFKFGTVLASSYTINTTYTGNVRTFTTNGTIYMGEWIQIQLPQPIVLKKYSIVPQGSNVNAPTTWYILGSLNGIDWYVIDTKVNNIFTTTETEQTFTITNFLLYAHYRFICNITTGTTFSLGEWKLFGDIVTRYPKYKSNLTPSYNTYGSGNYVFYSNTMNSITNAIEQTASKLFDKTINQWSTFLDTYTSLTDASPKPTIHIQFPSNILLKSYSIRGASNITESPSKWNLNGYNGSTWVLLDTETNISSWTVNETKTFNVSISTSYSNYNIEFLRSSSSLGARISIAEVYFTCDTITESRLVLDNKGRIGINTNTIESSSTVTVNGNITTNGNIGIGTNNPQAKLHVNGTFYCPGMIIQAQYFINNNLSSAIGSGGSMTDYFTGISVTIVPRFINSLIKLTLNCTFGITYLGKYYDRFLTRNGTKISIGSYGWGRQYGSASQVEHSSHSIFIDTPNTMSPLLYAVILTGTGGHLAYNGSTVTFIAEEIAQ